MQAGIQVRTVLLLLLSALAPYAEAMSRWLPADDTCGMTCCRKAKSCCCRKARPAPGWAAARNCPATCGQPAKLPGVEAQTQFQPRVEIDLPAPTRLTAAPSNYLPISANARVTGLQRPPPVS